MTRSNQLGFATRCVHAGQEPDPTTGAVMMPIYTTSTYVQQSPGVHKGYDYARTKNPTRMAFERCIADLEGGTAGFAFASGIAAIATTLDASTRVPTSSPSMISMAARAGCSSACAGARPGSISPIVDFTDMAAVEAAIRPATRLIWIETPTNPLLKLVDLERVAALAKPRGLWAAADNTFASPYVQRPLEYGFDIVVHSTTKYLNGHSDMVGGVAMVGSNSELRERMRFLQNAVGAIPGPFDSFLALRGLKTLALRMARHCAIGARHRDLAGAASQSAPRVLSGACESIRSTRWRASRCTPSAA